MLSCNMCNNSMVTGHYDTDYTNVCCCFLTGGMLACSALELTYTVGQEPVTVV
jgi:hypothetical protein